MKFEHATLSNGLTIIGETRESAVSVALGFFVKTGARDETPAISGVSHFLEHMMFKGTPTRTALDINYALAAMGAQANAFTSEENTVYYAAVLPEYFRDALELLSDMLRPSLDAGEFETERKVILEEIALYQDKPHYVIYESALRAFFADHPAGNSVLGTLESVGQLPRDAMKQYFDARYSPENIVLTAAGNFSFRALCELAEQFCGSWTGPKCVRSTPPHTPRTDTRTMTKDQLNRAHVCLLGVAPSNTSEERHASQMLSSILGDSQGSRVYWELIDKGLVESAGIDAEELDGAGYVLGSASCAPGDIEQVTAVLRNILATPLSFSDDELARAKTKLRTRLVLQGESSMRRLMSIGLDWLARRSYVPLEEELAIFQAMTRADIEKMTMKYPLTPITELRLLPA